MLSLLATVAIATPIVIPARSHDISARLRDIPALGTGFFAEHEEPLQNGIESM